MAGYCAAATAGPSAPKRATRSTASHRPLSPHFVSFEATSGKLGRVTTVSTTSPLNDLTAAASEMLTGERWAIKEASQQVSARPGLYAIYGDERAWVEVGLPPSPHRPLYVGKAEKSLVSRDLSSHFATDPTARARTGSSTVRRSFAALLRVALDLHAVPRNLTRPDHFANYALTEAGDARLSQWMHSRLTLAVWPAPATMPVPLKDVETALIVRFAPPINLDKNPNKSMHLSRARAAMALEASRWRPEREG